MLYDLLNHKLKKFNGDPEEIYYDYYCFAPTLRMYDYDSKIQWENQKRDNECTVLISDIHDILLILAEICLLEECALMDKLKLINIKYFKIWEYIFDTMESDCCNNGGHCDCEQTVCCYDIIRKFNYSSAVDDLIYKCIYPEYLFGAWNWHMLRNQ